MDPVWQKGRWVTSKASHERPPSPSVLCDDTLRGQELEATGPSALLPETPSTYPTAVTEEPPSPGTQALVPGTGSCCPQSLANLQVYGQNRCCCHSFKHHILGVGHTVDRTPSLEAKA